MGLPILQRLCRLNYERERERKREGNLLGEEANGGRRGIDGASTAVEDPLRSTRMLSPKPGQMKRPGIRVGLQESEVRKGAENTAENT